MGGGMDGGQRAADKADGAAGLTAPEQQAPEQARQDSGGSDDSAGANEAAGSEGRAEPVNLAPAGRKVIYTGRLTVRTGDVHGAIARTEQIVGNAGGLVHAEHVSTDTGRDSTPDPRQEGAPGPAQEAEPDPAQEDAPGSGSEAPAGEDSPGVARGTSVAPPEGDTAGGSGEDTGNSTGTSARLTLKVPPESFRDVMDNLGQNLGTLVSRDQDAQDVTERVADVQSRVDSARASIQRLRNLLDRAETVDDVLRVEEQLAQRQSELESLQARADALAAKTRYATVHLTLRQRTGGEPSGGPDGFVPGLAAGWGAFTATMGWLATAIGAVLPFLAIVAAVAAGAWWLRLRLRRRYSHPAGEG